MTTKITIEPAGHTIEVKIAEGPQEDQTVTTEVLGTAPRDYWIYQGRSIVSIRELSPAEQSAIKES